MANSKIPNERKEKSYFFSQNNQIEQVLKRPLCGGAVDQLWNPRIRFESTKSARTSKSSSSAKTSNLRGHRRLLSLPNSHLGKKISSPTYKGKPSIS